MVFFMYGKWHEKSVETALPELRVTTPTNSDKFSTPKLWRTETSLELVSRRDEW